MCGRCGRSIVAISGGTFRRGEAAASPRCRLSVCLRLRALSVVELLAESRRLACYRRASSPGGGFVKIHECGKKTKLCFSAKPCSFHRNHRRARRPSGAVETTALRLKRVNRSTDNAAQPLRSHFQRSPVTPRTRFHKPSDCLTSSMNDAHCHGCDPFNFDGRPRPISSSRTTATAPRRSVADREILTTQRPPG